MIERILNRLHACISNVQNGAWVEQLAGLRVVPPDGVYVIMPYVEISIHSHTDAAYGQTAMHEADEQS